MTKKRIARLEEFEPFLDKTVVIVSMDGKRRRAKLVKEFQFSLMFETNINTKENPVTGYMMYMKHGIRSISQVAE
ncbi:hypothetical protein ACE3L8_12140 [Staphylococcus simulans]|uniref:hypothetical protein n=1 Tax=Staphylococcus simulans TaxID=1286 RepID=UPI00364DD866